MSFHTTAPMRGCSRKRQRGRIVINDMHNDLHNKPLKPRRVSLYHD